MDRFILKLITNNIQLNARHYVRGTRLTPNAGIQRQLKIFTDQNTEKENFHEEYLDSEADFMSVQQQHKYWKKEAIRHQDKISNAIVKNKYFKEKLPNFLTWSEKEQIRQLYNEDPDEWNFEKLADSFPADINTIYKVVKSKWNPTDEKRIEKHDTVVQRNWESFKQNQIENINPKLAAHLNRFTNRENFQGINLQSIKLAKQKDLFKLHEPKSKEFSSLITDFNTSKLKQISGKTLPNTKATESIESTRDLIIKNNKPVTLAQLKRLNNDMKDDDNNGCSIANEKNVKIRLDRHIDLMKADGNESNELVQQEIERIDVIKEHIKIPKKLWKEGATYRIKDSFYDCDGEFLYRVPGMSST